MSGCWPGNTERRSPCATNITTNFKSYDSAWLHLKVIRTGNEDKSVGVQEFALRAKGDVTELRIGEQVAKDGSQV